MRSMPTQMHPIARFPRMMQDHGRGFASTRATTIHQPPLFAHSAGGRGESVGRPSCEGRMQADAGDGHDRVGKNQHMRASASVTSLTHRIARAPYSDHASARRPCLYLLRQWISHNACRRLLCPASHHASPAATFVRTTTLAGWLRRDARDDPSRAWQPADRR